MKKKVICLILFLVLVYSVIFTFESKVSAKTFESSIGNIYELRNTNTWLSGYSGNLRAFAQDAYTHGYYLGTQEQFLPYKVGKATLNSEKIVTEYEYAVFCTLFGAASPAKNSFTVAFSSKTAPDSCTIYNNWDIGIQAGVGAIINNVKTNNYHFSGQQLQDYYDAEIAINQFLYEKLKTPCNIDNSACGTATVQSANKITSYDKTLVALANAAYDNAKKLAETSFAVKFPVNTNLTYDSTAELWKSERITVTGFNKYKESEKNLSVTLKDKNGKVYNDYVYLTLVDETKGEYQIGVCNNNTNNYYCKKIDNFKPLVAGTYSVEVTIGGKTSYEIAQNYSCGSDFQTITPAFTNTKVVEEQKVSTFNFEVEEKTGKITIKKVDENGSGLLGSTISIVGQNVNYSNEIKLTNVYEKTLYGLKYGTYIIKEKTAPDGYLIDETSYKVIISEKSSSGEVKIINKEKEVAEEEQKFKFYLMKIDETNEALAGSKFNIYYGNTKEEVDNLSESGVLSRYVEAGVKVCVEETKAPSGYKIVQDKICFKFDENGKIKLEDDYEYVEVFKKTNKYYGIKIINLPKDKSIIHIKKIDATTNKSVVGAKLKLTDANGKVLDTWTTTDKTYTISGLDIGTYYIEEIEAPAGYSINKTKQEFKVTSSTQNQTIEFKNNPLVKVPNTLSNMSKLLMIFGVLAAFSGGMMIYKNSKEKNI